MDVKELQESMLECAKFAVDYAKKEFEIGLTTDYSCIYMVDRALAQLHQRIVLSNDDPIDPEYVVTLSNSFGAYIGELFRAHLGGEWIINEVDPNSPSIVLAYNDLEYPFPGRVFHRILGGEGNNVAQYFNAVFNECVAKLGPGQYVDNRDYRVKQCMARIVTE